MLFFIRSWRSTLIAAIAIPTSIISTFTLMNFMGFTLNQITMLALTLIVGIVIDDAIVVLENIFRFMEEKHMDPVTAAIEGTRDIGLAVLATTLSLIIIFIPIALMPGIVGKFMSSFGYTAAFAIGVSLLVSFTLTPMLCSRYLRPSNGNGNGKSESGSTKDTWLFRKIARAYRAMLGWSLNHRLGDCGAITAGHDQRGAHGQEHGHSTSSPLTTRASSKLRCGCPSARRSKARTKCSGRLKLI